MANNSVVAIDPGLSGAVAVLTEDGILSVIDTPTMGSGTGRVVDCSNLSTWLMQMHAAIAIIERAQAMPGQGVSSTFRYGVSFGQVIGVLQTLEIPTTFIAPGKWKRLAGLSSDKETSRRKAIETFPAYASAFARKKDHNRAEAALLAHLYARHGVNGAAHL